MARVQVRFDGVSTGARKAALETRAAVKGVGDQADRDTKRISLLGPALRRTLQLATVGLTLFAGASVVAFKKSIDAASNLEEQINKARVVFRGAEKDVIEWSKTTSSSIGISQRAALEFAGVFGNMLVPMGFARKEAAQMSTGLVKLAADMASFNNADPTEVLEALRAGLAGETEPLRRFGIFLNEARVQQEALNAGLVEGKDKLTAAGKAASIYRIILKDTADSQGDFARTSDSLANSQRTMRASLEDVAAKIGAVFLPAVTNASNAINKWLQDPANVRMLERWAETLEEGVATALHGIAKWVRENREDIVRFFRETANFASKLAKGTGDVADAMGGYDDAFKLILSGVLAAKLARVASLLGGAGILGSLTKIKGLGAVGVGLGLGALQNQLNGGPSQSDIESDWANKAGVGAQPAQTTPSGTVADPRGGSIGSLSPQSGSGGGVSFTAGVTKPNAHVVSFVARVAAVYGAPLNINSGFRPGSRVKGTGAPSQHGTGDAADIGPYYGSQLTAIGQAALIAAGMPEALAYKQGSFVGTVNGVNILFNTNVGGDHFNHVHVGLRSLPAAASTSPQTVAPGAVETSAVTSTAGTGGDKKAKIDAGELSRAQSKAGWIESHADLIVSPTLRARLRQRAANIAATLADVTDPKAFATAVRNLNALDRDWEKALELNAATKQARATARNIGTALGRMPEALQKELGPKLAAVNKALGNVTSKGQLAKIQKDMDAINAAIKAGVEKMQQTVERGRDTVGRALSGAADKALQVLDAKTEELLRKARALVGGELLGEGDLGPAGRALRDFRAARAAADRAASRSAALAGAETEEERAALVAQHALEDQEAALEQAAQAEERAIAEGLERERDRIRDERAILKERFQGRYDEIVRGFQNETLTAEHAQEQLLALLGDPEWAADFANAGALIGAAFADSFRTALSGLAAAIDALRGSLNELAAATGKPRVYTIGTRVATARRKFDDAMGFAGGGRVPGRYVGRDDTVMARLTPGETVLDRSLTQALERMVAGGNPSGPVEARFYLDGQEFARATAQPMSDEQARIIGYSHQST